MLWIVSLAFFLIWLTGVLFHIGGYFHVVILAAISIALVQLVARRRSAQ